MTVVCDVGVKIESDVRRVKCRELDAKRSDLFPVKIYDSNLPAIEE